VVFNIAGNKVRLIALIAYRVKPRRITAGTESRGTPPSPDGRYPGVSHVLR
jgi:hypothetical protein